MEYECHAIPIDKLQIDPVGVTEPLCNDCRTPDCTNPIREQTVYVMGIPHKMRLWTVGTSIRQIVNCKGYIGDMDVPVSAD